MKELVLAKVYQLLEPDPGILPTTARKGGANVMTMSRLVACIVSDAGCN